MIRATVTSRILTNKDTGLEVFVPSFRQTSGLLTTTVHYQVVVVSNLACFKSPSHKDQDVVQYSLEKKMTEFEELRAQLSELFSGTVLPPINKKSILVDDGVLKERKNSLNHLMKVISSIPKLSTCVPVLVFLGVDSIRAKKFDKGEPLDAKATASAESQDILGAEKAQPESLDTNVFGDSDDSGNEDFFGDDNVSQNFADGMFGNEDKKPADSFQVFEGQDMKRDLTEEDESDLLFVPDAILTKKEKTRELISPRDEEDHSDLFEIEDDLDQLLTINKDSVKKDEPPDLSPNSSTKDNGQLTDPTLPKKPAIAAKPKPSIPTKPTNQKKSGEDSSFPSSKPAAVPLKGKPALPSKPEREKISVEEKDRTTTESVSVDSLGQDDIMKYLNDNLDSNTEEVDLFS